MIFEPDIIGIKKGDKLRLCGNGIKRIVSGRCRAGILLRYYFKTDILRKLQMRDFRQRIYGDLSFTMMI